jgi:hypothetical protein
VLDQTDYAILEMVGWGLAVFIIVLWFFRKDL